MTKSATMRRMFVCDTCGPIDSVLVDGYPVDDLLENVLFSVVIDDAGAITATAPDTPYMRELNVAHWEEEVAIYAQALDTAQCPTCHAAVDLG